MTKQFRVPIIIDKPTADYLAQHLSPEIGRCRRLAAVVPKGMKCSMEISELLPPAGPDSPITDEQVAQYDRAITGLPGRRLG